MTYTFYYNQVLKIKADIFPNDDLIKYIIKAKQFIDLNFAVNINIDKISKKAYLSKFHFIRLFKTIYGNTPYQYLIEVRIKNAKRLLKKGITITEACFSVGFDSVSSFSGLFKKITGMTPSAFQKLHKKSNFQEVSF